MRLFADSLLNRTAAIGSPGIDELRWLQAGLRRRQPRGRVEILEVRPSRSRPDRGAARIRCIVRNQQGEVLTMIATVMFLRRPQAS